MNLNHLQKSVKIKRKETETSHAHITDFYLCFCACLPNTLIYAFRTYFTFSSFSFVLWFIRTALKQCHILSYIVHVRRFKGTLLIEFAECTFFLCVCMCKTQGVFHCSLVQLKSNREKFLLIFLLFRLYNLQCCKQTFRSMNTSSLLLSLGKRTIHAGLP